MPQSAPISRGAPTLQRLQFRLQRNCPMVDAPVEAVAIGAAVDVDWVTAANGVVPVVRLVC